ncbi:MAG TPA: circadian clock protein KaiC [Thermoanaerobaculia bacterium]|nr:circadian clock protein KaiC [Thermoanaerobaculia bacterium]
MSRSAPPLSLPKTPTGIPGLDAITGGGLPRGRPTLVCGSAGCGKTLFAMEFLVRGAMEFGEPGVFLAFEETPDELAQNVRSLGFDVKSLERRKKLLIDCVTIERSEIEETGEYDLEGLFLRLGNAIDTVKAKRVVLDTLEALFSSFTNEAVVRAELRRLFRWLKERGVTAVITAERGAGSLTRHGLEEYVSDCVILLDHRVTGEVATRRLRIVKYRGTSHGTNEYPFLIDERGFEVLPITSASLDHPVSNERISTGVPELDEMLGGGGFYRGSTTLISGTAGSGKSTLAARIADASAARGERCLYFSFEESPAQIVRNMRSVGMRLDRRVREGTLRFDAVRPTLLGLEGHLTRMHRGFRDFQPRLVVLDPISNLSSAGNADGATAMLVRLIDFFKSRGATLVMTNLTEGGKALEKTDVGVSSIVDTWILLRDIESSGERNRGLYVLKSRGMAHSNQIREFHLTSRGIRLTDAYLGPEGMLTGSARVAQELREKAAARARADELARRRRELARRREELEAEIEEKRKAFERELRESGVRLDEEEARDRRFSTDRDDMARSRGTAASAAGRRSARAGRSR